MATVIGAVYVPVLPSLKGIGTKINRQLGTELRGTGALAGQQLGTTLGKGVNSGLSPHLRQTGTQLDEVGKRGTTALRQVQTGAGQLGTSLRGVGDHADEAGRRTTKAARGMGSSISTFVRVPLAGAVSLLARFGPSAAAAFGVAAGAAAAMGVKANAAKEQALTAFTTMLQSGREATKFYSTLQAFAAKTPFELPDVVMGAQRLMAFGFQAKQVIPTLTAIGDAVAGLGGGAEQVQQVTNAIGQMFAKGKIQSDELLQLTEAGVPALRILANQYGVTTGKMQEMVSEGVVPAATAIPKLLAGIEKGTKGAAGSTTAFAGMMEAQSKTLVGQWSTFVDNFNMAMGRLMEPVMPVIKSSLAFMSGQIGQLPATIARVRAKAAPILASIGAAFRNYIVPAIRTYVLPALRDFWTFISEGVVPLLGAVIRAVAPVAAVVGGILVIALRAAGWLLANVVTPALQFLTSILDPLSPLLYGVAAALATWFVAQQIATGMRLLGTAIAYTSKIIGFLRLAWIALGVAFYANPIGVVIALLVGLGVAIFAAYNKFAWFRTAVQAVWSAIQAAVSFAYNNVIKPVFGAIVTAVQAVGRFFVWLWGIVGPILKIIGTVIAITAAIFLTVLVAPWIIAFKVLGAIFGWLWNVAIKPVLTGIGLAFRLLWTAKIKPAIDGIAWLFRWLYNNVIAPIGRFIVWALRTVGAGVMWLWRSGVQPALRGIAWLFGWVYRSIIAPIGAGIRSALNAVGAAFRAVYTGVIRPVWSAVGSAVRTVVDNVIKPAFNALKTALSAVGSFFRAVVNNVIKPVWNTIKKVAAAPINFVIDVIWNKGIRAAWNAIVGWIPGLDLTLGPLKTIAAARGTVLPGYAPGRDSVHTLLSPGEGVLVPEAVRMLGAHNVLALNDYAMRKRGGGRGGGQTGPTFGQDGTPGFFLGGIWDGIKSVGKGIANVAKTVAGSVVDAASFIAEFSKNPLGAITSLVPALSGLKKFASKGWGKAITQLPGSVFGGLISTVKSALGFEDDGRGGAPPGGAGLNKAKAWAHQQAGKKYLWGAVGPGNYDCSGLVGNLWAIKNNKPMYQRYFTTAAMGPGKFGMSKGKGAWTVYLGDGHTAANVGGLHAEAYNGDGTPLAIGRVGTPLSYYHTIMHMARGGVIPRTKRERLESFLARGWPEPPMSFDEGGWVPPGYSTIYNGTRRPEPLMNPSQWDDVSALATGAGGELTGQLYLDSGELLGVVRGEIRRADDATGRAIMRRTR